MCLLNFINSLYKINFLSEIHIKKIIYWLNCYGYSEKVTDYFYVFIGIFNFFTLNSPYNVV